ncbi:MAG TPA: serine hydrolase [Chitinophagaceae bacterium]
MLRRILAVVLCCFTIGQLSAQKTDKKLQRQVEALVKGFNGNVGVYVKDLRSGKVVAVNADTVFPTASVVKVPILVGVMDKIHRNELTYNQELLYRDSLLYAGVDILGSFKQDEKIHLSKVMMLMLTMSDNTASLWLQSLAGTGTRINTIMDSLGLVNTKVNSRTEGRRPIWEKYGWGQTTPREMATLFERIYRGEVVSRAASEEMLRVLGREYWDDGAKSQLPPYVATFSKTGAVDATRNEVVLVRGKKSEYLFSFFTKNNKDTSWGKNNEAWVLMRKISALLWEHYEPKDKWSPADGASLFD